jgi:hypothetical protein
MVPHGGLSPTMIPSRFTQFFRDQGSTACPPFAVILYPKPVFCLTNLNLLIVRKKRRQENDQTI